MRVKSLLASAIAMTLLLSCMSVNTVMAVHEDTVTEIGERAFERMGIRHITLPSTITAIGQLAFYYSSLEDIVFSDNVVTNGNGALSYCSNLTNLTLPDGVKSIGERALSFHG